jgi:hypothetical protein
MIDRRVPLVSQQRRFREVSGARGMHLLNQDQGLIFGIAWFWTLPEVHDVQDDIDALAREFRALFPRTADSKDHAPLPPPWKTQPLDGGGFNCSARL